MKKNRRPFFGRRFYRLEESFISSPAGSERKQKAEIVLRKTYASAKVIIFPLGEVAKKREIREEVQSILRSKGRKAYLLKRFHREFLGREAQ